MQYIVFAAFAIILSLPVEGPAQTWVLVRSPAWIFAAVAGHILAAGLAGALATRYVKTKLEYEASWLPAAQHRLGRGHTAIRAVLLTTFVGLVFLTDWLRLIRSWNGIACVWGLDEIIAISPFFAAVFASYVGIYPADRAIRQVAMELRLWASVPARPPWSLRAFIKFMFRQNVLIIAVPMLPIMVANDFVLVYAKPIRTAAFGILWADQAVLVAIAGLVFLVAPVMLRYIWHTRVLPDGELRRRLEDLCRRVGLKYRRILIWESDGMVVNAAVMGLLRPVRYILLSDGLLEMMDDAKIEAVFGHEAGHVKCRHIEFYLLFAVLSMLIVGGVMELIMRADRQWPALSEQIPDLQAYLPVLATGMILLIWWLGFGAVSRQFELQADLFGARSMTRTAQECGMPCLVHQPPAISVDNEDVVLGEVVCASAAALFAEALNCIAALNGIPIDAKGWRHSSIAHRMAQLRDYAVRPGAAAWLDTKVLIIKASLLAGTVAGLLIALLIYSPHLREWRWGP
ncbi:MAG: M48 family metalloprotease [Planctomycetes bacterium]|nr:M48 family metalloprotease [Planctomycetota bacterium]